MSGSEFDQYVDDYRDIINRVSSVSGEQYEFFIDLRLKLMKSRITKKPHGMKILDFGCGTGATELFLKDLFPGAAIYGVDSSTESILTAKDRHIDGVTFVHSDAFELPFPSGYFDLIYSNGTYHHIDPSLHPNFLSEMSRVCRTGGSLFIFENNPRNPLMMRAMRNNPFDANAMVVHPRSLQEKVTASGFTCKEVCYYFFFPRFLRLLRSAEKWLSNIPFGAQYFLWSVK